MGVRLSQLDRFARDRHGVITRLAAKRAGVSERSWYRAIAAGSLEQLHPGVARIAGTPVTIEQRVFAAVAAAGSGALASHGTAAHLWGIPGPEPTTIDVIVRTRSRRPTVSGATIHRPRDHKDLTPVLRAQIPTTNILRTMCDLGALEPLRVPGAVGHVITTRMVRPQTLLRAVIVHSRQGRAGVPALREALHDWHIDGKPPDSVLEPAFARLARRFGLPSTTFHARIGPYEVDFLVDGTPLVIECDGWGAHALDRRNWERGMHRDGDLTARGYIVIHLTYRQIVRDPGATARRILATLDRWGPTASAG